MSKAAGTDACMSKHTPACMSSHLGCIPACRETQVRRVFVCCIALTLSFVSSDAPCARSTSKHGTRPFEAAYMRAVVPI